MARVVVRSRAAVTCLVSRTIEGNCLWCTSMMNLLRALWSILLLCAASRVSPWRCDVSHRAARIAALQVPRVLRLRGHGDSTARVVETARDGSLESVSDITGMVSTIFFSSSGALDDDMVLPQALPVSDVESRSLDRDFREAADDPHLPPLVHEWNDALPLTGRQYLRRVRRETAQNYIPVCMSPALLARLLCNC